MSLARPLFALVGVFFVAVGALGVVVPGLPTTVFLLIAVWCFSKASPRLAAWLRGHRVLGVFIRDFERDRSVPRVAKVAATVTMVASLVLAAIVVQAPAAMVLAMGLTFTAVLTWLWGRPEPVESADGSPAVSPAAAARPLPAASLD